MKRILFHLTLATLGTILVGCNEKISPKLQNGGVTGGGSSGDTPIPPEEYVFSLKNQSPTVLGYKLHRTGKGRANTDCKITKTAAFTSDLYKGEKEANHDDKAFDITCFMEVEELSLWYNGLDIELEVSENTCDYIGYAPFSYFKAMPGSSSTTFSRFNCGEGIDTPALQAQLTNFPASFSGATTYGAPATQAQCGQMIDNIVAVADRVPIASPSDDQLLCRYGDCDIGYITIKEFTGSIVDALVGWTETETIVDCGGSIRACVDGPINKEDSLSEVTRGTVVEMTTMNEATKISKSFGPLKDEARGGTYSLVNFRWGLSNTDLDYEDYTSTLDGSANGLGDNDDSKFFMPQLMERYASNLTMDFDTPTKIVSDAALTAQSISQGYKSTPYAAEPFMGLFSGYKVQPFYTFTCLDKAFETKARIRFVVREWDKVFPTNSSALTSNIELLSDAFKPMASRRLDVPVDEEEIPGDPSPSNLYNDFLDWDDKIFMQRTPGNFVETTTTWSPEDGWFNDALFPGSN